MFKNAISFRILNSASGLNNWDTSKVTDMSSMFYNAYNFNEDIGSWNTSCNYHEMMFFEARDFNHDIGSWDVSSVSDMSYMFAGDASNKGSKNLFNQDLSSWDVSSVSDMSYMFYDAAFFNNMEVVYTLLSWDVSNVENMSSMFHAATYFNQYIGNDVSNVTDMAICLGDAKLFNNETVIDAILHGLIQFIL